MEGSKLVTGGGGEAIDGMAGMGGGWLNLIGHVLIRISALPFLILLDRLFPGFRRSRTDISVFQKPKANVTMMRVRWALFDPRLSAT